MTFLEVIDDVKLLQGLTLQSIRPGAEILIKQVDVEKKRIIIETSSGVERTRPLSELQVIWEGLLNSSAIHVDEVLHGSGTSRNQPETIFASLPYIEWFKYKNKKHISYVGQSTHSLGTLKEMDSMKRIEIQEKIENHTNSFKDTVLIVTDDVSGVVKRCEFLFGTNSVALQSGIYVIATNATRIYVVLSGTFSSILPMGTYPIINQPVDLKTSQQVDLDGMKFSIGNLGKNKLLFKV